MADAFLSTFWYRVAKLRPRLRGHVTVHRHRYRGQPWYVLHDHAAARIHRFTPGAYMVMGRFDGRATIDEIWSELADSLDADAPSQDDVIQLLSKLHQQDLIQYEGSPDVTELLERYGKQSSQLVKQNLLNPVSIRIPLWDPDAFLTATLPFVRGLTGWFGLFLWLGLCVLGGLTAAMHWAGLTSNLADRLLAAENILITLVAYPLLKGLHELAHGWLAKVRGAEVREMGIMFLVFFPVPYVDASAAAAFRNKWDRASVSAGGIIVETAVAAIAVMVWASAETGFVTAVAFNLAMIGGLSTVLVNANPLLKFDGYYIFTDIIEVPNLAQRSNKFWGYLIQRYIFGAKQMREKVATWGERAWFTIYAPAAFAYRIFIMVGIALFVAQKYLFAGVLLGIWSIFNAIFKPLFKHLRHVAVAGELRKVRRRAVRITAGSIIAVAILVLLVPLPLRTDAEGVVWLPESSHLRAGTPGFVAELHVPQGTEVSQGVPLIRLEEPSQAARAEALSWRVEEASRRLTAAEAELEDRAEIAVARASWEEASSELSREQARSLDLSVRAPVDGWFEPVQDAASLTGRFFAEGDLLGYVLPERPHVVRVVVPQKDISLVRSQLTRVEMKLAGHLEVSSEVAILREVPAGSNALPAEALALSGGGVIATDPSDPEGLRTVEQIFVFDLSLPDQLTHASYGKRVYVRFSHGWEPAGAQIYRRVRQLFLRQFNA